MITYPLDCSCCGAGILAPEENTDHGKEPYPHDEGHGMCRGCGGDDRAVGTTEAAVRRRLGWAACTFAEARFDIVRRGLNAKNLARFDALSFVQKVEVIYTLVERGVII